MITAEPLAEAVSREWAHARPEMSVVIATHDRAGYLPELFAALAAQRGAPPFEVVVADDGSPEPVWAALVEQVTASRLPALALRLPACGGPSVPRNTAVERARGALLAVTDDDCVPDPGWLAALAAGARGGVVQGRTVPARDGQVSPWDRTIAVDSLSGLWESCNLALPRALFEQVGGFPVLDLLPETGRGFGEDTVMGARAARVAGGRWQPEAVVRHRWVRSDYRGHLDGLRRLVAMPALVGEVPELRGWCYLELFRNRRSAAFDLAVLALADAVVRRRPVAAVAALPWLAMVTRAAGTRWGRPLAKSMVQEAAADAVAAAALVRGSVAARTPLL